MVRMKALKNHLRVDHDEDDKEIEAMRAAAVILIEQYTHRCLVEETKVNDSDLVMNKAIEHAIMMIVSTMYNYRETIIDMRITDNIVVEMLVHPFRILDI